MKIIWPQLTLSNARLKSMMSTPFNCWLVNKKALSWIKPKRMQLKELAKVISCLKKHWNHQRQTNKIGNVYPLANTNATTILWELRRHVVKLVRAKLRKRLKIYRKHYLKLCTNKLKISNAKISNKFYHKFLNDLSKYLYQ